MSLVHRRRLVLKSGVGLILGFTGAAARAHEYYATTVRISHPWCRATTSDHAVICMTFDEVLSNDRLVGVETPVATRAEMGGKLAGPVVDFPIPAGLTSVLDEDHTYVRLVGLQHPLEIARSYPLKLVFERGGEVNATLDVAFPAFR